jgi:hypothetical protein
MSDLSNWVSKECNFCGVVHYSPTEEELVKVICSRCNMALGPLPGYRVMLNKDGKPYWIEEFTPMPGLKYNYTQFGGLVIPFSGQATTPLNSYNTISTTTTYNGRTFTFSTTMIPISGQPSIPLEFT